MRLITRQFFSASVILLGCPVFAFAAPANHQPHDRTSHSPQPHKLGSFQSRALGLSFPQLEAKYGPSSASPGGGRDFGSGRMNVLGGTGQRIEYTVPAGRSFSLPDAHALARRLSPPDARLIRRETTRAGLPVEVFLSRSLARRFHPVPDRVFGSLDPWYGAAPGTFIAIYRLAGDQVSSVVVATGNNP